MRFFDYFLITWDSFLFLLLTYTRVGTNLAGLAVSALQKSNFLDLGELSGRYLLGLVEVRLRIGHHLRGAVVLGRLGLQELSDFAARTRRRVLGGGVRGVASARGLCFACLGGEGGARALLLGEQLLALRLGLGQLLGGRAEHQRLREGLRRLQGVVLVLGQVLVVGEVRLRFFEGGRAQGRVLRTLEEG